MLPFNLKPIYSNKKNLLRLGPERDGGYILDKRIINTIKYIVTCGLNDDWDFEKDFQKIRSKTLILAYDHTVTINFWMKRFIKDFINLFLFKKLRFWKIVNIFKFLDYFLFFRGQNKHYKLKISNKTIPDKEISLKKILKNKDNILLKIDIEGSEYLILNDILKNYSKINCLIIEFHNIKKNIKKIENFIKKMKNHKIVHIHGNNIQKLDKYGYPFGLEITLINGNKINLSKKKNEKIYPINELDFPNVKRNQDIRLLFR